MQGERRVGTPTTRVRRWYARSIHQAAEPSPARPGEMSMCIGVLLDSALLRYLRSTIDVVCVAASAYGIG